MNAIGLIEVVGYVAAIEACDACVKSANVNILSIDKVGAGIVTLSIVGDVGAVKSAIEAGEVAANKVGTLRSTHVIPRVHKEVADGLLKKEDQKTTQKYIKVDESLVIEEVQEVKEENLNIEETNEKVEASDEVNNTDNRDLLSMNVKELKTLAKKLDPSLTSKNINSLRKEDLVDLVDRLIKGDK
nr:BMC domain-containing protein [uncultured Romboutsia sp.]